ncbi:LysR family transcriptional regulator [Shewanella nanhaiensis]|uniref:LysR family transcriptional regulator n=1 Tax=Shewanella nanhaiensis TaxID=2864872 RepID=A0ABS7E1N5_9GAMM|nr:LysR family transcriptional regulator [Shewanella nanhaiensis]MBW8183076.1 LysR family transcriptional regulator [Shewanella nanhaiensis]
MDIKLQQLKYFSLVAEKGGFRAASDTANRSQAALSTSVKELEKILGQALFDTGHKAQLTPYGEVCLPMVNQFLNLYQSLDSDLRAAAKGEFGRLKIASVPSVAAKLLPKVLAAFCSNHPEVQVSLIDDNAVGIEKRLLAGEVDLALGNCLHASDHRIEFSPLFTDPLGLVCQKEHPLASKHQGVDWTDIIPFPFIKNGTCRLLATTPAAVLAEQANYDVENITSLFSVLELGVGVTTLPKLAFPIENNNLVWVPLKKPFIEREIGIFRSIERHLSPQADAFLRLCQTQFEACNTQL